MVDARADRRDGPQGCSSSIRLCPAACTGPGFVAARAGDTRPVRIYCPERAGCSARASVIARPRWPGELPPGPPDLRTSNITEGTRSMLRGVLSFLPLVLDLAGIFLALALHCLSLALCLLAQTHDRLLSCPAAPALPHTDRVPQLSCRRRGAPVAPCSTRGEAQTFQRSRLSDSVRGPRVRGSNPLNFSYRENGSLCKRSKAEMTADARTAWPGVIVVSTGRCGSTMLSNMLRLNPEILSLSEFFSLLMPDPFPAGGLDAAAYWRLLSEPWVFFRHAYRLGLRVPEFLYAPGPGSRFTPATGIPPILVTALPHLSDDPEGLYDEVEAFVAGLTPASAAAQHRRLIGWLCDRLGARAWVERSGSSLLFMSQLADLFRDAKFVHLYRDGRECAYSFSRHPGYRLAAVSAMLDSRLGMSPYLGDDKPPEQVPPDLQPFMPETFDHEAFERFELSVAECGQFWSDMIIPALDILASLPAERVLQVSYENLVAEPRQALLRLARFADLPDMPPGWLDRALQLAEPRSPRWTARPQDEIHELTRVCERAMRRLYGDSW